MEDHDLKHLLDLLARKDKEIESLKTRLGELQQELRVAKYAYSEQLIDNDDSITKTLFKWK